MAEGCRGRRNGGKLITLACVMTDHWHAVQRDLLALGLRADDIGTPKLTLWELVSIVVGSQPGTAVHYWTNGWSREAELLANLGEQQAGLHHLNARYFRPGVDSTPVASRTGIASMADYKGIKLEPLASDEFTQRLKERQAMARKGKGDGA